MLNINHDKNWMWSVFLEQAVDFNIMRLELSAGRVPADNFFSGTDLQDERLGN